MEISDEDLRVLVQACPQKVRLARFAAACRRVPYLHTWRKRCCRGSPWLYFPHHQGPARPCPPPMQESATDEETEACLDAVDAAADGSKCERRASKN